MTQGMVVVRSGGRVIMKVVAGCDGQLAKKVAAKLRKQWPLTARQAHALALELGFGSQETLVVMTESGSYHETDGDLSPLYYETFADPEFNPRWERGTVENLIIIDI